MTDAPRKNPASGSAAAAGSGGEGRGAQSSSAEQYQYNYTYVAPVALVDKLPRSEKPSLNWYVKCVIQSLRIARNRMNWAAAVGTEQSADGSERPLAFAEDLEDAVDLTLNLDHLGLAAVSLDDLPSEREVEEHLDQIEQREEEQQEMLDPSGVPGGPMMFADDRESDGGALARATVVAGKIMKMGILDPLELLSVVLKATGDEPKGRPAAIQDYKRLFTSLPLPWTADSFQDDTTFGWLRVAGANPLVIRRIAALDATFPVTEETFRASVADRGDSLARAGAEGRLFLADYAALAEVEHGNFPSGPKYCFAPKALFALPRGDGPRRLRPIAIQCGQDPARYPLFTPADGDVWLRAKLTVEVADNNHHEMISHLGRTHFLISPFAIATHRRLAADHPLSLLLRPHFEGTLSINNSAQATLVAKGHEVDKSLAGTIDASRKLAVNALAAPYFNVGFLPDDLAARGVTSPDLEYPYRDDALLVWRAIERWVSAYVAVYYGSDADVAADRDLSAWGAEIVAKDGGRLLGFGEGNDGKISTVSYLVKALTMIVFTASAQHAAVNFAQAQLMSYTPAAPLATFRAAPLSHGDARLSPYLDMLAPLDLARIQMEFLQLLGGVYYTQLGDYGSRWFGDPKVREILSRFQQELRDIKSTIEDRNKTRLAPYPFLIPDQIPQSINM